MIFSLLHATKGRPDKALACARMWRERMANPNTAEHIFACESTDPATLSLMEKAGGNQRIISDNFCGSAPAWNAAYRAALGEVLVQVSDDMEPPRRWDDDILGAIALRDAPVVLAVSDGFRKDRLMTTAICTRAYADTQGEFLHPGYQSVFSDDEFTYRAYKAQKENRAVVIEARDIVIFHRHHYHDKAIPWDTTYEGQNSADAYNRGALLFARRNPDAGRDGIIWK